jgi:adenylate cyclase
MEPRQIISTPAMPTRFAASEAQELTILFADIRGFSRIAEQLDPLALHWYVHRFLTEMTEVILRFRGTVDKYIGDSVMAYWGAPRFDPEQEDQALYAAFAMVAAARTLDDEFRLTGRPRLEVSIGVNTGMVQIGHLGPNENSVPTVIGDAVNLAARFQSMAHALDVVILAGARTAKGARSIQCRCLGEVAIRGRQSSALVYEPLGPAAAVSVSSQDFYPCTYPENRFDELRSPLPNLDVPDLRLDL